MATYYVSPSGSNSNPGTLESPWLTVAHAITQLSPLDTLYLRGGVYADDWNLDGIPSGASWGAMTTLRNYPGETPIIRPGTAADVQGFFLTTGQYICLQGLELDFTNTQTTGAGVKITEAAHHVRIQSCHIHHLWSGHGILLTSGSLGRGDSNQIFDCVIHHCGYQWDGGDPDHGIYIKTANNKVSGCRVYQNNSAGIHGFDGTPAYNVVLNSRFWDNQTGVIWASEGAVGNLVFNCLAWDNGIGFNSTYNASQNKVINCTAWDNAVGFNAKEDAGPGQVFENCIAFRNTLNFQSSSFNNLSAYPVVVRNCLAASNVINAIEDSPGGSTLVGNLIGDQYATDLVDWARGADSFYLTSSSAARGAGLAQTLFATDIDGIPRPVPGWDIGAHQYDASALPVRRAAARTIRLR